MVTTMPPSRAAGSTGVGNFSDVRLLVLRSPHSFLRKERPLAVYATYNNKALLISNPIEKVLAS